MKISRRDFLRLIGASSLMAAGAVCGGCGADMMDKNTLQSIAAFILPEVGHLPSGTRQARIEKSPNFANGQFQCPEPIADIMSRERNIVSAWARFVLDRPAYLAPSAPIPSVKINLKEKAAGDRLIWLGHSSAFFELSGKKILLDPIFRPYASPISFINRAFDGTNPYTADDFPNIDLLLLTHDHWDHLDCPTVMTLEKKTSFAVCPLGVGGYLEEWGWPTAKIREGDWGTEVKLFDDLSIRLVPGQHFSGRMLARNKTEWAGFIVTTPTRRLFISGDGGYGQHFAASGQKYGPFDLALVENGQYNEDWHRIHLMPEETARAAADLNAKALLPIHNGKFALARHPWDEPLRRIAALSEGKKYRLITPKIGKPLLFDDLPTAETERWWERI